MDRQNIGRVLRKWGLLLIVILLLLLLSIISPRFRTFNNFMNILRSSAIMGIFALGLTIIMNAGDFDLSFPGISALSAIISAVLLAQGMNLYLTWIIALLIGLGLGFLNGILVAIVGIPAFVSTLGLLGLLRGISGYITKGASYYSSNWPDELGLLGRSYICKVIPVPVITFLIFAVIALIFVENSRKGRHLLAVGGNNEAASHVGINVTKMRILAFVIGGFLASLAGITTESMLGMVSAEMNMSHQMPVISTAFLGSVFLKDGVPNVAGSIVAAVLLAIISNGLSMLGARFYVRDIVQGLILLLSVGILVMSKKGDIKNLVFGM